MVSEASSISRDGSNIASEADRIAQYEAHIRQQDLIFVDRVKRFLWIIVRACLVIGISFIILYPILMKISSALKDWDDLYNPMVVWLPEHVTMENFRMAYKVLNYVPTLTNSFLLSAVTMVTTVLSCALAGYGFARFNFKGNNLLFALVILTILVPTQTLMVPLYMHFRYFDPLGLISLFNGGKSLNLVNTYAPTIMLSCTSSDSSSEDCRRKWRKPRSSMERAFTKRSSG
jgi:multiple sugar transport system permease protein